MGTSSVIFLIVALLHIAAAIVGFGGIIAHGAYNARAFAGNAGEAGTLFKATKSITNIAHYGLYALFALGIVLVSVSDKEFSFSEAWISASFVVWFAVVGIAHGMVKPAMNSLQERASTISPETPMKDDSEVLGLAKKLALGEGLTQLLLVVALVLMVWQPGH